MLALAFPKFDMTHWTTWVVVGAGVVVMLLVLGFTRTYRRWRRRRLSKASWEEDLDWQALLSLLQKRNRERAAAGLAPDSVTEEELAQLIASMPAVPNARPVELPEDREFRLVGGNDRRAGRRRWGNPIEVHLFSSAWTDHVHGLVVNRSDIASRPARRSSLAASSSKTSPGTPACGSAERPLVVPVR
jgi:hypothetical protein